MPLETQAPFQKVEVPGFEGMAIVDSDVHHFVGSGGHYKALTGHHLRPFLSPRWRDYMEYVGRRHFGSGGVISSQRPTACRLDAFTPDGDDPGTDPGYAVEQLLDTYGISAAILNNVECITGPNAPVGLEIDLCRATNEWTEAIWFASDPRWLGAINIPANEPEAAVEEIERCCERSDRWAQVLMESSVERPHGNPKYWPIYEAAEHHGLPVAFHVGSGKHHRWTGVGGVTFYYQLHSSFPLPAQAMVASFIFEGVFERFPNLKLVPTEVGWEWVVPLCWRLDASWRILREEVRHVQKKPSEYMAEHFWFSTQPAVEPENPEEFLELWEMFERAGFGEKLLFASDYPHWDMDSPFEATPQLLPRDTKAAILGRNAAKLYGLDLDAEAPAPRSC